MSFEIAFCVKRPSPTREGWERAHAFTAQGFLLGVDDVHPSGVVAEIYNSVQGWHEGDGGTKFRDSVLAERDEKLTALRMEKK